MNKIPPDRQFLTRKDIAGLIETTVPHIMNNETKLGLINCKIKVGDRFVRYRRKEAMEALIKRGFFKHDRDGQIV